MVCGEQGRVPGSSLYYSLCLGCTISSGRWNCRNYIQCNSCLKFFAELSFKKATRVPCINRLVNHHLHKKYTWFRISYFRPSASYF